MEPGIFIEEGIKIKQKILDQIDEGWTDFPQLPKVIVTVVFKRFLNSFQVAVMISVKMKDYDEHIEAIPIIMRETKGEITISS